VVVGGAFGGHSTLAVANFRLAPIRVDDIKVWSLMQLERHCGLPTGRIRGDYLSRRRVLPKRV
jgi:hypothetical protein